MSRGRVLGCSGLVLAVVLTAGCGNDESVKDKMDANDLIGSWHGTMTDSVHTTPEAFTWIFSSGTAGTFFYGTGITTRGTSTSAIASSGTYFTFTLNQTKDASICRAIYSGRATLSDSGSGVTMTATYAGYEDEGDANRTCNKGINDGILSLTRR